MCQVFPLLLQVFSFNKALCIRFFPLLQQVFSLNKISCIRFFSSFDEGFFPSTRHYVLGFLLFLPQVFSFNKSNAEGENLTSLSFASLESIPAEKLPLRHDSLPSINHLRQPRFVIFCNNRDHGQKETGGLCSLVHKRGNGKETLSSLISFIQKSA